MDKKLISSNLNCLLFVTLNNYKKIASPKVSFFTIDNVYDRLPGLLFRFENGLDSDYEELNNLLYSFLGKEKWVCFKVPIENSKNYFIETLALKNLRINEHYDTDEFKRIVDNCVEDFQPLCDFLSKRFNAI